MDAGILSAALNMRLTNDLSVNERLQSLYPHLSEEEADRYRRECGFVLAYGSEVAEKMYLKELPPGQRGNSLLLERFPWLQAEEVSRVLSYGFHGAVHNYGALDAFPGIKWETVAIWGLWFAVFVFALFLLAWWLK